MDLNSEEGTVYESVCYVWERERERVRERGTYKFEVCWYERQKTEKVKMRKESVDEVKTRDSPRWVTVFIGNTQERFIK
jgi:hypothetical protein